MSSFGTPDGVTYCAGDEPRTVENYHSLEDPLGGVVFHGDVSTLDA